MHSEISVRFVDPIRFHWLIGDLPGGADPADVLDQTYFSNSPDVLTSVIYARLETTFVYLVFKDDGRSIRVHVEGRAAKGDLRQLVQKSEHLAEGFVTAARNYGAAAESVCINLYADDDLITSGLRRRFGERLLKRFAETIFGDVVVGGFTGLFTLLGTRDWTAGAIASLASTSCFLAWLAIELTGGRDEYEYEGF